MTSDRYSVRKKDLKKIDEEIVSFIKSKYRGASGIIYCTSRQKCEQTAEKLNVCFSDNSETSNDSLLVNLGRTWG